MRISQVHLAAARGKTGRGLSNLLLFRRGRSTGRLPNHWTGQVTASSFITRTLNIGGSWSRVDHIPLGHTRPELCEVVQGLQAKRSEEKWRWNLLGQQRSCPLASPETLLCLCPRTPEWYQRSSELWIRFKRRHEGSPDTVQKVLLELCLPQVSFPLSIYLSNPPRSSLTIRLGWRFRV